MNSVNNTKNINITGGHQYNFQHMIFVTKYRYKMFRNPKTVEIIRCSLYDVAERYKLTIKELSFGEDYAHVHLEVSVLNTMSVSYVAQLLKGYSSYVVFKEMPRHRLRYFKGHFWTAGYSNGSVGPRDETTLQNYIRRQNVSNIDSQRRLFN
jgi:putative transposase